jgi:bis(5'-nucleosyl)-tetraphosphatase (symmetrical)
MAVFVIGDVQGCCDELKLLIDALNFDAGKDQLWFVGDLVNRGPKSLETLRFVKGLGDAAICVLGNHDLHLLALAKTPRAAVDDQVDDQGLQPILQADDRDELINWLIQRPLAHYDEQLDTLLVHAGVDAAWSITDTLKLAGEVENTLRSAQAQEFLTAMYGSKPSHWDDTLAGMERLRFITNCLTRIRYCTREGELDFAEKLAPGTQPDRLLPWFDLPERKTGSSRIVFGHWSTLGLMQHPGLIALDTGCVWGESLTAIRLDADAPPVQIASQQPRSFNS